MPNYQKRYSMFVVHAEPTKAESWIYTEIMCLVSELKNNIYGSYLNK